MSVVSSRSTESVPGTPGSPYSFKPALSFASSGTLASPGFKPAYYDERPLHKWTYTAHTLDFSGSSMVKKDTTPSPSVIMPEDWQGQDKSGPAASEQTLVQRGLPEVLRHEKPTLLELFSDLFFVAALNIFTAAHEIVKPIDIVSYLEFEFLIWSTWFLVVVHDVRFLSDSWTERIFMFLHLGIMVAFIELAPFFSATSDNEGIAITTGLTLLISRTILTFQYGITLWHLRFYPEARTPMMAAFALNLAATCIYAVFSAARKSASDSDAHHTLVVVSALEVILNLATTMKPDIKILSFEGTHLAERLSLLTLIILGEGVIKLAKSVDLIERGLGWAPWSIRMWVVFISALAAVYIIFQIYFDWMHTEDMASGRQLLWAILHAPFHFALLLVMVAVNQFVMWWRIMEVLDENSTAIYDNLQQLLESGADAVPTGQEFAQNLNKTAMAVLDRFAPSESVRQTLDSVVGRVNDIAQVPDDVFRELVSNPNLSNADMNNLLLAKSKVVNSPGVQLLFDKLGQLMAALTKTVLSSFKLKPFDKTSTEAMGPQQAETVVIKSFDLVFAYAFVATGSMLLLLTALHAISKKQGWTAFNLVRSFLVTSVGIGLCLVPVTVKTSPLHSPIWALPTICGSLMIVLVITHVPHPGTTSMLEDVPDPERAESTYTIEKN